MPVTLAEAQVNTQDDVDYAVIDQLRRYSLLMDMMTWDDCVHPAGGGATLTYGYTRLVTPRTAAFRAYNTEYVPGKAQRQRYTVELRPLGGSYEIDRVLANLGPAATNEQAFQMDQLLKGTQNTFQDAVINGDRADTPEGFDGLDKALSGSTTEVGADRVIDWTAATINDGNKAHGALDEFDGLLSLLHSQPSAIVGNTAGMTRVRSIARRAGYYARERDDLGRMVETYGGVPFVDLGDRSDGTPIVPIRSATVAGSARTGLTDIYAVRFGLDAFHGVSTVGQLIRTWDPDYSTAGAVKKGEVEMGPVACVLKHQKAAAVLRNVKVQ